MVYWSFWSTGRSLVKTGDSIEQHVRVFLYYGEYLRGLFSDLFVEHRLSLPEWDMHIGYGGNILTTFHYYCIGDPLAFFSVFASGKRALVLYQALIVARNYLAGLAFSYYCLEMGAKHRGALLGASCSYAFCVYALNLGLWHPFFLNPMIHFPLVLVGVERVLRKGRPYALIGAVALSAASNFYFFYMIAVLTAVYSIVRLWFLYGKKAWKTAALFLARIAGYAFLGVLLASPILLPVLRALFLDYRQNVGHALPWHYDWEYYPALLASFTGAVKPEARTLLTYGAAALPAALFLFLAEKKAPGVREARALFLIGWCLLLFPVAGFVLNGCSYVANRWTWGFGLVACALPVWAWDRFFAATKREVWAFAALAGLYAMACIGYASMRGTLAILAAMWGIVAFCALCKRRAARFLAQGAFLALMIAGIGLQAFALYTGEDTRLVDYFYTAEGAWEKLFDNPDAAVREIAEKDDGLSRYTGPAIQENSNINGGTYNTQFYWSLSNGNIAKYLADLQVLVWGLYYYTGLDDRAALETLAGCRYYVAEAGTEGAVPYGFSYLCEKDGYDIYENAYALPLAYPYDTYLTREQFEDLNAVQKQDALMRSVLLETDLETHQKALPSSDAREIPATLVASEGVEFEGDTWVVTQSGASVTYALKEMGACETYVEIGGFDYEGDSTDAAMGAYGTRADGTRCGKTISYRTAHSPWPSATHDFLLNLGYGASPVKTVTFRFSRTGSFRVSSLRFYGDTMETYAADAAARMEPVWSGESVGQDRISGQVSLKRDQIVLFTVPFDGGWTAYVDGKKQVLLQANGMFSALALPAGEHAVTLVYHTPGLLPGIALAALGIVRILGMMVARRRCGASRLRRSAYCES